VQDSRAQVEGRPQDVACIVDDGNPFTAQLPAFAQFEFIEGLAVDIAAHCNRWCDGLQAAENMCVTDVACVQDSVDARKQTFESGVQEAVSVR